ncbi:mevalonate kinase [Nitrosopumilus sp. K4]|uniref:mevalonate kinase n=1 Tax=Nitrosopumilus sp. K4 TaxID=2795383 RepID=UPI001BAA4437|nr:mevalonate kinase [Nitrosopumilus sp. K4]QUC64221.1 mevalonate kinase [Nitrosopumilus sp. K4]
MKSKASAPGKVILFGEHFVVYGVKAILCAIDKRITVTAEQIPEDKISIKSNIGKLEIPTNESITEIDSPLKPFCYLASKLIQKYNSKSGINITVESEIPLGVGLGSSSACCVAGAAAISQLFEETSKEKILELAIEAEKTIFQNTSGADCTVCAFGGLMEYDKKKGFSKIDTESNFHLVIVNSNIEHSTDAVVSNVKKFKDSNEEQFLNLCKKESELINKVMKNLKNKDLKELGNMMHKNQEFLETIGISNEKLRQMINVAETIAYGAKITGAGGGGCIIALTDESNLEKTISQLRGKNYDCFSVRIDHKGLDTF